MTGEAFRIGFLLFPNVTQLDFTGPYDILGRLPGAETHLVAKTLDPVRSDTGLMVLPTVTLALCPPLDLVCVPGGPGVNEVLGDVETLDFLRRVAPRARYVTSVCTGSFVLGAAGLLRGRRAASHWMSRPLLRRFGAEPVAERVVIDDKVITGGGVTAGIDFALKVVEQLHGKEMAEAFQLGIEYDPAPPFDTGSPEKAGAAVVERVIAFARSTMEVREAPIEQAVAALARL
jgi:cyclohexyl-isocyanide hydratase